MVVFVKLTNRLELFRLCMDMVQRVDPDIVVMVLKLNQHRSMNPKVLLVLITMII